MTRIHAVIATVVFAAAGVLLLPNCSIPSSFQYTPDFNFTAPLQSTMAGGTFSAGPIPNFQQWSVGRGPLIISMALTGGRAPFPKTINLGISINQNCSPPKPPLTFQVGLALSEDEEDDAPQSVHHYVSKAIVLPQAPNCAGQLPPPGAPFTFNAGWSATLSEQPLGGGFDQGQTETINVEPVKADANGGSGAV